MRYRTLGATGISVSEVGFGTWGIGGNHNGAVAYGPTDTAESQQALLTAVDTGINFFDTADFYGFGHSEEILGQTLHAVRNKVVLASKAGMIDAAGTQDFSPAHIQHALEGSLRRLQTDYIDLYQLHSPPIDLLRRQPEIIATLEALKRAGKIRAYGISVRSPDDGLIAVEEFGFQCLQVNFNLLDQRALENGLFDLCHARNVGLIVRTPLVFGFLTGQYTANDSFAASDHRRRWTPEQIEHWAGAHQLFQPLIAHGAAQTPSQFALRFCLSFPAVSTVIPGMLQSAHVLENGGASDLGLLDSAISQWVVEIYQQSRFFVQKN